MSEHKHPASIMALAAAAASASVENALLSKRDLGI